MPPASQGAIFFPKPEMMTAEKLEQKVKYIKRRIGWLKEDYEREMRGLKLEVESDYVDMDMVIAAANRVKKIELDIDYWTDKLHMVEDILEAEE